MATEVIPLGTASAIPAQGRHLSATALLRQGRLLLFDCGEGTQFRLLDAGLKRSRIDAVFITHVHGDHFYGLMGVMSTLGLLHREDPLTVVGPSGLAEVMQSIPGLASDGLPYPVEYVELAAGVEHEVVWETEACLVEARPLEHRVFTVGYRFQEKTRPGHLDPDKARALGATAYEHFRMLKAGSPVTTGDGRVIQPEEVVGPPRPGSSFAYVTDTRPCEGGQALAREVDLLYHEATFGDGHRDNAVETGHSTAREAAEVAREAEAERLLLGHFSARYDDVSPLVREAQAVFQNTEAAQELKRYALHSASR